MKLKDIIVVSLLGVVGLVVSLLSGIITQVFGTYGIFVHVSIGSLLCAPVYFVMCHKIAKRGTIFIYYLLSGIIYAVMGFIPMLPIMLVAGILGEACIGGKDNYINDGRIGISYVVSQVIYALHGFFFILFLGVEGLVKTFPNLFTVEKAQMARIYWHENAVGQAHRSQQSHAFGQRRRPHAVGFPRGQLCDGSEAPLCGTHCRRAQHF